MAICKKDDRQSHQGFLLQAKEYVYLYTSHAQEKSYKLIAEFILEVRTIMS